VITLVIISKIIDIVVNKLARPAVILTRRNEVSERNVTINIPIEPHDYTVPSLPVSAVHSNASNSGDSSSTDDIVPFNLDARVIGTHTMPDSVSAGHRMCAAICEEMLAGRQVYHNYRHPQVVNPDTGRSLEFDIFYPDDMFGVEFQGSQHYHANSHFGGSVDSQAARDHIKAVIARDFRIRLVTIPYTYRPETVRTILRRVLRHVNHVPRLVPLPEPRSALEPITLPSYKEDPSVPTPVPAPVLPRPATQQSVFRSRQAPTLVPIPTSLHAPTHLSAPTPVPMPTSVPTDVAESVEMHYRTWLDHRPEPEPHPEQRHQPEQRSPSPQQPRHRSRSPPPGRPNNIAALSSLFR
jgi:hypothetical protein